MSFKHFFSLKYLLTCLSLIVCFSAFSQKNNWEVSIGQGGGIWPGWQKMVVDHEGNVIVSTIYSDNSYTNYNLIDVLKYFSNTYLAKYTPSGKRIWKKALYSRTSLSQWDFWLAGYSTAATVEAMAVDKDNNILIAGRVGDTTFVDGLKFLGFNSMYFVKIKPDGKIEWSKQFFSDQRVRVSGIECFNNSYYLTGHFKGNLFLENIILNSDQPTIFISKFNTEGKVLSAKKTAQAVALGTDIDQKGNLYFAGNFSTACAFDNYTLTPETGAYNMFFAKADTNFNFQFAKMIPGKNYNSIRDIKADTSESFYITGIYNATPIFQTYFSKADVYLGKFDAYGNELWKITEPDGEGIALDIDTKGDLYYTGVSYGPSIKKYSPAGNLLIEYPKPRGNYYDVKVNKTGIGFGIGDFAAQTSNFFYSESRLVAFRAFYHDTTNKVKGKVYYDKNQNCTFDDGDIPLKNYLIKGIPGDYYTTSDQDGNYTLFLDTGTFVIQQFPPTYSSAASQISCPASGQYTFKSVKYGIDTAGFNFANQVRLCKDLTVSINSSRKRRCATNRTIIEYANNGVIPASNVKVIVEYPGNTIPLSSSPAWTSRSGKKLIYNINTLPEGTTNTIVLTDSVACIPCLAGSTECIKATIEPIAFCSEDISWDKSYVKVDGSCIDYKVRFVIRNSGTGDMSDSSSYRIFKDNEQAYQSNFKLIASDSLVIELPGNGQTFRLEADQLNYPEKSSPSATVEACGISSYCNNYSKGKVLSKGFDDDKQVSYACAQVVDSYDPNDKTVIPSGILSEKFVSSDKLLTYVINFQNTGTDTAYKVVIRDTLDASLDPAGITEVSGSHPFTYTMSGKGKPVLNFTFENINLPDSTKGKNKSCGFVRFKAGLKKDISQGTTVKNKAYIFFDYNDPVITNEAYVTIYDTVQISNDPVVLNTNSKKSFLQESKFYPNPLKDQATLYIENTSNEVLQISLTDLEGKVVFTDKLDGSYYNYQNRLNPGMYIYKIESEYGIKSLGKILIIK